MVAREGFKKPFYIIEHAQKLVANSRLHRAIARQLDSKDPTPLRRSELQNYAYYGIGDGRLRTKLWKVFLYHYSENKFKAEAYVRERRAAYAQYLEHAIEAKTQNENIDCVIAEDVNRTVLFPVQNTDADAMLCEFLDAASGDESGKTHRDVLKTILLVFKVTNPAIDYVQGMHMLMIVIYYVLAGDNDAEDAVSDTFFCFLSLVSEIGEYFVENMDDKYSGIIQKLNRVIDIVKSFDPELYENMRTKSLDRNIFHFRWVILSFAREFHIDDVVWLWDRLLSDSTRFELVLYCAAAKIVLLKERIMESDFSACMKIFQESRDVDVHSMFFKADEMRRTAYML